LVIRRIASNDYKWRVGKNLEGDGSGPYEETTPEFTWGTKENQDKPQSG